MRKTMAIGCGILAIALSSAEVEGRGGRGGGGFHGGGGARGGGGGGFQGGGRPSINRSPSMSTPQHTARPANSGLSRPSFTTGGRPGGSSRPAMASRPESGNRPAIGSRPGGGQRPDLASRPNLNQRPGISERPGIGDRPAIDRPGPSDRPGGRPGIGDRPGVDRPRPGDRTGDRPGDGYRPDRPDWANNRPGDWGYNHIDHSYWHHGNWHDHWDHGWYNRPAGWWWGGFATGVAASAIPWNWGYYSYYNPYAVQPIVVGSTTVDYSQPLVTSSESYAAAPPPSDAPPSDAPPEPTPAELAAKSFDAARESFTAGDYKTALSQVEEAISRLPDDATLHEFRALVLFATGRYKEAAAAIYAVLSAGPGWDWTTLGGLYSSIDTYTKQLRGLEAYCRQNPNEADAQFLLGYHYLTLGETSAAAAEFKQVVKLNPKDTLAAQLLASLEPPPGQPAPAQRQPAPAAEPPAPQTPVTAASLAGRWKATQPDGTSVALDLGKDAKYTWRVSKDGKQHDFSGSYTVADNLLILNQNNSPAMVGQVAQLAAASFNFRLPGAPPSDPGLTFSR